MWPLTTIPREKQLEAFHRSCDEQAYAYFMEMGTGKTLVALAKAAYLYDKEQIDLLLVLAPKGVILNWPSREVVKHWPERLGKKVVIWPKRLEAFEDKGLEMVFMNIEALSSSEKAVDWIFSKVKNRKAMLVVDESSTLKSATSKRSKCVANLSKHCRYRVVMTGSPVTQAPLDLFSQVRVLGLSPQVWPFSSLTHFKCKYAVTQQVKFGHRSFNQIVGYKNIEDLQDRLKVFSYRALKKDCLDLPEKIYLTRDVELSPEQIKAYDDLAQKGFHAVSDQNVVTAAHAMVAVQKLQQVLCGHLGDPENEIAHALPHKRIEALLEVAEELQGQVIIWSTWRYSLKEIGEALRKVYGPNSVAEYWGGIDTTTREQGLKDFEQGKARFFLGNPKTGGYGLTLVNCKNVIYYNNGFSLEERLQSEDRCHRMGQTEAVTYVDLVVPETVDEKILKALMAKQDIAAKTLGDEWREWFTFKKRK